MRSVFLRSSFLVLLETVLAMAQTEKYTVEARSTYPVERYILFVGQSPASGSDAEALARSGMEAQLNASLSDALSQSRQHAGNSSLARSASRMDAPPAQEWGRWIRIDQSWTTQREGTYLALAVVPVADLRAELERQYEDAAVTFRTSAKIALSSRSLPLFLENCKTAQIQWASMAKQAILMACIAPLEEQGLSLTTILDDDRKLPYEHWQQDRILWAKLEEARTSRSRLQATATGPLAKQLLSSSLPLLSRKGLPAATLATGAKCRFGLLLTLSERTECSDISMGYRCQSSLSWSLDECVAKANGRSELNGFKQGDLDPMKAVSPVGEDQARRALMAQLATQSYDTLLVHSLLENLPSSGK